MKLLFNRFFAISFILALHSGCQPDTPQETTEQNGYVSTLVDNLYGGTGGVSVDKEGNIYSSDFGPFLGQINPDFNIVSKVFKITPAGEVSVFLDSLQGASGSDFDSAGNFFQSNIRGGFVSKVAPDGMISTYVSDSIAGPVGVLTLANGDLLVCNCGNNTLRKITSNGDNMLFSSGELFQCPNGITGDEDGNFYVANFYDGNVIKVTSDGIPSLFATIPGNNNGHLIYRAGYLYVVARTANQIYRVSLTGQLELFAGSGQRGRKNGGLLEATFSLPNDLDFSPDGKYLYVNEISDSLGSPRILVPTAVRRIRMPD